VSTSTKPIKIIQETTNTKVPIHTKLEKEPVRIAQSIKLPKNISVLQKKTSASATLTKEKEVQKIPETVQPIIEKNTQQPLVIRVLYSVLNFIKGLVK
jgi:hypothetical protein